MPDRLNNDSVKVKGQPITFTFILAAIVSLILRFFWDWPIVIMAVTLLALVIEISKSARRRAKFSSGQVLVYLIAASMILAIMEYFYLIK